MRYARHGLQHILQRDVGSVRIQQGVEAFAYDAKLMLQRINRSGDPFLKFLTAMFLQEVTGVQTIWKRQDAQIHLGRNKQF